MSDPFSERLRAGGIEPNESIAQAWLSALHKYADSLPPAHLPDLVRLAFDRIASASEAADDLRAVCNEVTPDRELTPTDRFLVGLLACQLLIEVFTQPKSDAAVRAALLVRAARFSGWDPAHIDVVAEANVAAYRAAASSYAEQSSPRFQAQQAATRKAIDELSSAVVAEPGIDEMEAVRTAIVELRGEVQRLRSYAGRLTDYVRDSIVPLREQNELLWWIVSSYSLTAERVMSDLPGTAAPCIIACDFAQIAPRAPGPVATDAFLNHALRRVYDGELPKSVAQAAAESTRELGIASRFPEPAAQIADFLPILGSIHSADNDHATAEKLDAVTIARQTYDEILLARDGI